MADDVTTIARAIEAYLASHPQAADTIEGIVRGWLRGKSAEQPRGAIEDALALLVAKGAVDIKPLRDGRLIYSLRRKKPPP